MPDIQDLASVQELLARYANSFDTKAWDDLAECLADTLYTDYSQLRKTPPEMLTRERFVELRRSALDKLDTHHLLGNIQTRLDGDRGEVIASMIIFRRNADGARLDTHCLYTFGVYKSGQAWLIRSIVQKVLLSEGHDSVHTGIASNDS